MRDSFDALRERQFRLLFTGQIVSLLGDAITGVGAEPTERGLREQGAEHDEERRQARAPRTTPLIEAVERSPSLIRVTARRILAA